MKKWFFSGAALIVLGVSIFGCQQQVSTETVGMAKSAGFKGPVLLAVDFKPDVPLKYNFVCERRIALDMGSSGRSKKGNNSNTQNFTEKLEVEMVYKPVKVDPYGYTVIEATCESAKVTRTSSGGRGQLRADAAEFLAGKSFTLKITPIGKVTDYSSLESLIKELGQKAFGGDRKRSRIKDPDMIMDFVATQWSIWDSVSSIKKPLKGLKKNRKWDSKLLAPMPFVSKVGRDVEYKLADVVDDNGVSLALITSNYKLSKLPLKEVPLPYSGSFQMRGTFGFLQGYKVLSIEGTGWQLYDIEKGLIKSDTQQYKAEVTASIFGLGGVEPNIEINQMITTTLIE
ncbi:MAG: hypothetical protein KJ757_07620 [Planctomycetes bacterium]|nr:hypothetical protein [Planctomycetota bacterium]MBU1517574.1 hypothetical protein [Planctomycetota bacterium]MBU2597409.1 hypothetical protein [Planctomycetota bacterium]